MPVVSKEWVTAKMKNSDVIVLNIAGDPVWPMFLTKDGYDRWRQDMIPGINIGTTTTPWPEDFDDEIYDFCLTREQKRLEALLKELPFIIADTVENIIIEEQDLEEYTPEEAINALGEQLFSVAREIYKWRAANEEGDEGK